MHGNDLAFHARDLVEADEPALAVAHALELQDDVQRGSDLTAHALGRQVETGHADHLLEPGQGVAA